MTSDDHIRTLWAGMAQAWAAGDASAFASAFAGDCEFTTVRGEKPPGREGIAAGHARLFGSVYRGTRLTAEVRSIRHRRPGLATVDVASTITAADGTPIAATHALAVVEQAGGQGGEQAGEQAGERWSITAFHNMIPAS